MYTESDNELVDQRTLSQKIQDSFAKYGLACLIQIYGELKKEDQLSLRIAVTGRSGVGKSSFINTLRGVTAESKFAADTGVTETTREVKEYRHPKHKQMVLCDLPGVGTKKFPKDTYLTDKTVAFETYDMFIILTSGRVFDDDIWLAKEAKIQGKLFLFVRTQVDLDIDKERKTKPTMFKENAGAKARVLNRIRSDLKKQLKENDLCDDKNDKNIFLLDSTDLSYENYDFKDFNERVFKEFPAMKREAFIQLLTSKTSDLITKAVESNRTWFTRIDTVKTAFFSFARLKLYYKLLVHYCRQPSTWFAFVFALPIPVLPTILYLYFVPETISNYLDKLGLTKKKLEDAAKTVGNTLGDIKEIQIQCVDRRWRVMGFLKYISFAFVSDGVKWASVLVINDGVRVFASFFTLGIIFSFIFFLWASVEQHNEVLDVLKADALKMDEHFQNELRI